MQRRWIAGPIVALALISSTVSAQSCKTTDADKTAVVDAVRTLYAGGAVHDMAKVYSVTAPTYYAFDSGDEYRFIDDLLKVVKASQDQGVKYIWNVTRPAVTIHCNEAWITYVNDGSVQMADTSTPKPR